VLIIRIPENLSNSILKSYHPNMNSNVDVIVFISSFLY